MSRRIVFTILSMEIAGVNIRIDDVDTPINDVRTEARNPRSDHVRFEERWNAAEVPFGKIEQRLEMP